MGTPADPTAVILARLEMKVDQLLQVSGDHEQRLRKLEERRWPLPVVGAATGVLALALSLVPLVTK